ncbi:helicase and polymerase containing protein tebichi [Metarhizium guizhouense ARSEF 977]|uniref:Helicase and polymerase containing protein tebichi n=1 Tax=Metarhizium guizhouense (strain ARSEF 977) TaxID=1276136 RepID=A0A0B4GUI2_METGA|nr:helicase and polymerase containing protein tebichi [Metarhizium guizhouense ARSEF 977]
MKSMQGLLHKTSFQTAHEQQQRFFAPQSVAGQKRPWSSNDGFVSSHQHATTATNSPSHSIVHFQKAISLPSAPKRLSAMLMLKRVIEEAGTKALLVLPYVALVQEKVGWLRKVVQHVKILDGSIPQSAENGPWRRRADYGTIRVVGFFGGGKVRATWDDFDIGVCTLEKANALVNTAIADGSISKLRSVVLDELHIIDDDHRGYMLELIAAKLVCLGQQVQLIGMSATLPNLNLLAAWLHGHTYETRYRPVPIEEHLVYDGKVFRAGPNDGLGHTPSQLSSQDVSAGKTAPVRRIENSMHKEFTDSVLNAVVSLAHETACMGYGVLVFAGSRGVCESDARWISRVMPELHELAADVLKKRLDLLGDLRSLSTGADPVLEETVLYGVAFHPNQLFPDAGLTSEERDLIAAAYDAGTILVCIATCSLAAGINLPARRVILHNVKMGREYIGPAMLRQMRGRAGRQGKTQLGETYLCCRQPDLEHVLELMHADIPKVSSCLSTENRRIQRALLEVISIRLATSRESISDYFSNSLLQWSQSPDFVHKGIELSLEELQSMGLIMSDSSTGYAPTQLGKAIVASAIDPDDGVFFHKELVKALRAFVMDGEMHILYVFTPVHDFGTTVNWQVFRNEMECLDESGIRVLQFLGIKPTSIIRLAQGAILKETTTEEKRIARVYRRFYLAMQLRDLCNEVPIHAVARKYDMPRGSVQTLSQTCQGFAAGMVKFCEHMGWGPMAAALDHFSDRLMAGARSELLALSKVPFIKSRTARVFFENGYRSVAALANANPKDLVPILMQAQPNKLRIKSQNDELMEEKMLAKANVISSAANRLWNIQMQAEMEEE